MIKLLSIDYHLDHYQAEFGFKTVDLLGKIGKVTRKGKVILKDTLESQTLKKTPHLFTKYKYIDQKIP